MVDINEWDRLYASTYFYFSANAWADGYYEFYRTRKPWSMKDTKVMRKQTHWHPATYNGSRRFKPYGAWVFPTKSPELRNFCATRMPWKRTLDYIWYRRA